MSSIVDKRLIKGHSTERLITNIDLDKLIEIMEIHKKPSTAIV